MGTNDESFLDLLDTDGANYDMDELDVDKILGTSATNNKEKGKSAAATQSQQRESTGSHRKQKEQQQKPAEHQPVREKKRVEYQPQPQHPVADDAMEEDGEEVRSSSGRAKRPRIQLPEERQTTIRASSSKSVTRIFKFRAGATGDEVRMQRKLRFSGADHRHEKSSGNKRGGGEIDEVRARRAARFGTTATAAAETGEQRTKWRATSAASGGADAGALKRLGVPMKSRKDLP